MFTFTSYKKLLDRSNTYSKRIISRLICSIFDINGEIEPFVLKGKVILSKVWAYETPTEQNNSGGDSDETETKSTVQENVPANKEGTHKPKLKKPIKLGWDDPIPKHLEVEFKTWIDDLKIIAEHSVKRYIFGSF